MEGAVWGLFADPDYDGLDNLLEYALGLHPGHGEDASEAFRALPVDLDAEYLMIEFTQRKNDPALQYFPEVSSDLQAWFSDNAHVIEINRVALNSEFDRVIYMDLTASAPGQPRFIRLRVRTD